MCSNSLLVVASLFIGMIEAFQAICKQKLVQKLAPLDILHVNITWTLKVAAALEKFTDWVILEADEDQNDEAGRMATVFRKRFVNPTRKLCQDAVEERLWRRYLIDLERSQSLPKVPMMNSAAQEAMFDVAVLHAAYIEQYRETGSIPAIVRNALNAKVYGIAAFRTFAGRPGDRGDVWLICVLSSETVF